MDCPFDCVYLQEARLHEKAVEVDPAQIPDQDIRLSESFLRDNEALLVALVHGMLRGAMDTPGVIDSDVREALDTLIRTHRTLESGVYYESRPANPLANFIYQAMQQTATAFRDREREQTGVGHTRDADVLGVLVFLRRMELSRNNGRPRGRAFLDFLRIEFRLPEAAAPPSQLIVP